MMSKLEAIVSIILQIFCNAREKMFTDSLLYAAWDVLFWVFFGTTNEQKRFPFICNNHKTLSHLELNLKRLRNVLEQRCIQ